MVNIHATALVVDDRGVLILGPSGSGKTTLALALAERATLSGRFARLVADDRVDVLARGGRLLAGVPATIAGLCEIPGFCPSAVPHERRAVIDLAVQLVPAAEAPRFSEDLRMDVAGHGLPALALVRRNVTAAVPAILARLDSLRPTVRGG